MAVYKLRTEASSIASNVVFRQPVDLKGPWMPAEVHTKAFDVEWETFKQFLIDINVFDQAGVPKKYFTTMGFFMSHRFHHREEKTMGEWIQLTLASARGRLYLDSLFYRLYEPYLLNQNS